MSIFCNLTVEISNHPTSGMFWNFCFENLPEFPSVVGYCNASPVRFNSKGEFSLLKRSVFASTHQCKICNLEQGHLSAIRRLTFRLIRLLECSKTFENLPEFQSVVGYSSASLVRFNSKEEFSLFKRIVIASTHQCKICNLKHGQFSTI